MPVKTVTSPTAMSVAVSTVILAMRGKDDERVLSLPLVRRIREPYVGQWALPGGWLGDGESLEFAAGRALRETTGLQPSYLEQLYTFGMPGRSIESPEGRVISIVYSALICADQAHAFDGHDNVAWFDIAKLPTLAFDHNEIVEYSLGRLRNKIEYADVAFFFLGNTFSLRQLREVYEVILQKRLDPANFRRRVESAGTIVPTKERIVGGRHRPPRLYRCADSVMRRSIQPAEPPRQSR